MMKREKFEMQIRMQRVGQEPEENTIGIQYSSMSAEECDKEITLYDLKRFVSEMNGVNYDSVDITAFEGFIYRNVEERFKQWNAPEFRLVLAEG